MARPRRYEQPTVRVMAWVHPDTAARLKEEAADFGCSVGELLDRNYRYLHEFVEHPLLGIDICCYCNQPRRTASTTCRRSTT